MTSRLTVNLEPSLLLAAEKGLAQQIEKCIAKGVDVNCANKIGMTPLMVAAENGHKECVKLLVANQADIHRKDSNGCTALYWAARRANVNCVMYLLTLGCDPYQVDNFGKTVLDETDSEMAEWIASFFDQKHLNLEIKEKLCCIDFKF